MQALATFLLISSLSIMAVKAPYWNRNYEPGGTEGDYVPDAGALFQGGLHPSWYEPPTEPEIIEDWQEWDIDWNSIWGGFW